MKNALKRSLLVLGLAMLAIGFTASEKFFEISKNLDIFATLYKEINVYYVDETKPGKLIKDGIDGMLKALDPYTVYYPESQIEDFKFMTTGQYGGIGALIRTSGDYVVISEPYEGFAAHKSGLRAGDCLLEIDGKSAFGKNSSEVSTVLKGQPQTIVSLKVYRPHAEDTITVDLKREEVKVDDVPYYGTAAKNVGYIKLNGFTESASREVKDAFVDLKENKGITSLILDLRGNGGGLLREAVNIVSLFVPKGQEVVYTKGKVKEWDRSHKTINPPLDLTMPLAVLIDGSSASASEIVAGTLQDLDRAVVIGENSFGKGLVQQTKSLTYNAKLKLTVAKYYTPSGRCIQRVDYSKKDRKGKAQEIPDSLIHEFKTKNGRPVFDGAGIRPDIEIEREEMSPVLGGLLSEQLIFEYANYFRNANDSIPPADVFEVSDDRYNQFLAWLEDKEFDYTTSSEEMLESLREAMKTERYYDALQHEIAAIEKGMSHNKEKDLLEFKDQISSVLGNELVSRYHYRKGRIAFSLPSDKNVLKAIELFKNQTAYQHVLTPQDHH